jgi:hypothetical protein
MYGYGATSATYRYEEVPCLAVRVGNCPGCGRKVRRQRTFTETVNPFNKINLPDGTSRPKTWQEVWRSVSEKAAAWSPDAEVFRHEKCRETS